MPMACGQHDRPPNGGELRKLALEYDITAEEIESTEQI
jgi:hypothetical protein